jgi:hypothetical protein
MKHILVTLFAVIICLSCNNSENNKNTDIKFESRKILIDLSYPPYTDTIVKNIMHEIKLCLNSNNKHLSDSLNMPFCDHKLFRVFDNTGKGFDEGFLVEVKEGVYSHTPQVINIVYRNGKYIITNNLKGELLEMRTTPSGCYDILVRYIDKQVGTITIIHIWNGYEYEPLEVLEINDHFVKDSKKDSLYDVYISNFVWGY